MSVGVMFHHFVDGRHPLIQGALTGDQFEAVIKRIGPDRILRPEAWIERSKAGTLRADDVCLTFDDALLSQADVAAPILRAYDLKAFFFVYTSVCEGEIELFEVIRYFRNTEFPSPHDFYDAFYEAACSMELGEKVNAARAGEAALSHLSAYKFYTAQDRIFRYVRDRVLDRDQYYEICTELMRGMGYDVRETARRIWLDDNAIKALDAEGHMIGLHSSSHPTNLGQWPRPDQEKEYGRNRDYLVNLLAKKPLSVAYPSGCYNDDTLDIMREFGIDVGFLSDAGGNGSILEQPRLDHSVYES